MAEAVQAAERRVWDIGIEMKPQQKKEQADLRALPPFWETTNIASLLAMPIQNGVFNEPSRKGRGCRLINVIDLYGRFPLDSSSLERFDASRDELARFRVKSGDLFFTRSSLTPDGIAQCNIYQGDDVDDVVFDCHVIRVRPDPKKVDPSFLARYCSSSVARKHLVANAKTTTMTTIDQTVIARLPVALPPPAEQRAIAAALSDVDALLDGLGRLIVKKRDLKHAVLQQLLTGKIRLPGFSAEWEASTVGDEFDIQLGKMLDAEKNIGVLKPYLGNRAVQWDRIDITNLPLVPLSDRDMERFRLKKGDLLVCEGGEVGRAAIWNAPIAECYYQKALHRLRPRRGFDPRFMAGLLRMWSDRGMLANYVTQTSIAHLPRDKFMQVPMHVPPPEEQSAIADVVSEMEAELAALQARRDKIRALKQGMMQELLTGRTRLI
jgi:type I restriction enzyme S subunit